MNAMSCDGLFKGVCAMLGALAFGVLLAACSATDQGAAAAGEGASAQANAPQDAAVHPQSGLQVAEVVVVSGDKRIPFRTELALSAAAQQRGLMFRETLADDEAMLFPSDAPQARSFWMKNTPISLDIIFIGTDRRILNIETAEPYSLESVRSDGEAIAVFEIRGGLAGELGIAAGDRVEWDEGEWELP